MIHMRMKMIDGKMHARLVNTFQNKDIALNLARRWTDELGGNFIVQNDSEDNWEIWVTNFYGE